MDKLTKKDYVLIVALLAALAGGYYACNQQDKPAPAETGDYSPADLKESEY